MRGVSVGAGGGDRLMVLAERFEVFTDDLLAIGECPGCGVSVEALLAESRRDLPHRRGSTSAVMGEAKRRMRGEDPL